MSRTQLKRTTGDMARYAIVGFFILLVACGVGFGAASADSADDVAQAGAFGFDEATHAATAPVPSDIPASEADRLPPSRDGGPALVIAAPREVEAGLSMIEAKEEAARQRAREEQARAVKRMESSKAAQGVVSATDESGAPMPSGSYEYGLPAVDWSQDRESFITTWAARIDAYLTGSVLEGYGTVFAQAAWENGVDPRWSPAISNTESGKGSVCFLPCNAWGWGSRSWSNWTSAIHDHVAGLADGYGYSITTDAALKYCPPTYMQWYEKTLGQMRLI